MVDNVIADAGAMTDTLRLRGRLSHGAMFDSMTLREAYEELGRGNAEPLVALMDEEMEWRGPKRGWRFWEPPPS